SSPPVDRHPNVEIIPAEGRVDIRNVLGELYARGIHSVIVEGGSVVHSELIARGLWQKMILFVAPMVVGGLESPALFSGPAAMRLTDAHRFRFDRAEFIGRDLMLVAYPA
ncbi:MAG TPA: dihydrofolate reductase family protein, partial [Thermoanaerobaculia bacterium]|nr:dihydrofolate reductase family protein [Thermoanaerobaculia bacterium]